MPTFIFLLISFIISGSDEVNDFSERFKPAVRQGIIEVNELSEVSGMVASRKNNGNLWVLNDSGNEPRIYLINKEGKILHSAWLKNSRNVDWEDIAIKIEPVTGNSKLVVADIGDNGASREFISLLVFDEPDWTAVTEDTISSIEQYDLKYDDGARDAETILVDPQKNVFYIISKREEQVRIYESPDLADTSGTINLNFKATLPFQNVTSGDISADGSEIILKNYTSIFYWQRNNNQSLLNVFKTQPELLHYMPEPQGESLCWSIDGMGFYTLSEKSWADKQVLYFYERTITE